MKYTRTVGVTIKAVNVDQTDCDQHWSFRSSSPIPHTQVPALPHEAAAGGDAERVMAFGNVELAAPAGPAGKADGGESGNASEMVVARGFATVVRWTVAPLTRTFVCC